MNLLKILMTWKRKIFTNWNLTHPNLNAAYLLIDPVNPEIAIQSKKKVPHDLYADKLPKDIMNNEPQDIGASEEFGFGYRGLPLHYVKIPHKPLHQMLKNKI